MAQKRGPRADTTTDQPPLYDPSIHTDPDQMVYVELYSTSGAIWRQRDPVSLVEPFVRDWIARQQAAGFEATSKAGAVAVREGLRKLQMGAAYEPRDYPNLDAACKKPRPWPVFPDQPLEG